MDIQKDSFYYIKKLLLFHTHYAHYPSTWKFSSANVARSCGNWDLNSVNRNLKKKYHYMLYYSLSTCENHGQANVIYSGFVVVLVLTNMIWNCVVSLMIITIRCQRKTTWLDIFCFLTNKHLYYFILFF